ncbi:hypothetical protein PEC730217_06030 [Pectobacterium carotovorum subsp. carotovorum]|nr:hypothetical protein PEC730217_06030 [Pectobacterium carotovorum subsp. carotovorum]
MLRALSVSVIANSLMRDPRRAKGLGAQHTRCLGMRRPPCFLWEDRAASYRALCRDQPPVDEKSDRPQLLTTEGNGTDRQQDAATDRTTPNGWGDKSGSPCGRDGAQTSLAHLGGFILADRHSQKPMPLGSPDGYGCAVMAQGCCVRGGRRNTCRQVTAGVSIIDHHHVRQR